LPSDLRRTARTARQATSSGNWCRKIDRDGGHAGKTHQAIRRRSSPPSSRMTSTFARWQQPTRRRKQRSQQGRRAPQSSTTEPHAPGAHRLPTGHPSSQLLVAPSTAANKKTNRYPARTTIKSAATACQTEELEPDCDARALVGPLTRVAGCSLGSLPGWGGALTPLLTQAGVCLWARDLSCGIRTRGAPASHRGRRRARLGPAVFVDPS
jgi:hypothetical protein